MQGVNRYLVCWKGFTAENDTWEKGEDLGNAQELVNEFEIRLNMEVRQHQKVEVGGEIKRNLGMEKYRRSKLPGKYMAKLLYG